MSGRPSLAELPVQRPSAPADEAQARARFFNSGNAFNLKLPPVPAGLFDAVAAQALAATRSGWWACDQSAAMGQPGPATTPLMLARYGRVAAGDELPVAAQATATLCYVIEGEGVCTGGGTEAPLRFAAGDVFLLPGGTPCSLKGGAAGALLWVVDNQPQLALEGARPGPAEAAPVARVHYPAAEIERQLALVTATAAGAGTSGHALIFSSEQQEARRNLMPSLTLSLNTLPPGEQQAPHRHNSAAITLVLQGERCHSRVDGQACAWRRWSTMVTPPGAAHSHHNAGGMQARFLIVQDGGLHYHARTMGFEFLGADG